MISTCYKTINSVGRLVTSRQNRSIGSLHVARRHYSLKYLISRFLRSDQIQNKSTNMDQAQKIQQEKEQLEARIVELVGKLESKKAADAIKLDRDQILKSKEDQEAAAALDKLELEEKKNTPDKAPIVVTKTSESNKTAKKKSNSGPNKDVEKPLDVSRLDLRIGKIIEVERHPDADALYLEKIDCGDATGPRTVISGLVKHVPIEDMRDRLVVVLCNLKPAKMRGILSEAMVMCASTTDKVELIKPPANVKPGDRLVFDNYPGEPDEQLNPKKKIWEQVSPDIKTNDEGVAFYKDSPFKVTGVDGKFTSDLKNVQIR